MGIPQRAITALPSNLGRLDRGEVNAARALQRQGFTFTEIAARLQLDREDVVHELYWRIAQ